MKRKTTVVASIALVAAVAAGGVAVAALASPDAAATSQAAGLPAATAPITRGDLSDSTQVQGTLEFSGKRKLNAGAVGTLTWVPKAGSTITRDGRLYEVNGTPVRLMYGTTPMYRALKTGDKGQDVRQLNQNLRALGFSSASAGDTFTYGTAAAVKSWQHDHGLARTGTIGPDEVAFTSGRLRIASASSAVGDQANAGQPVLTLTGLSRVVGFKIDVSDAKLAPKGTAVSVGLPDGTTAQGKVASVGATAQVGTDLQDKTPKIDITVALDHPGKGVGPDQSPVTVNLTGQTRKAVLTVPVNALLALPGGGFGVQVVENGKARDVHIDLGMFGQGRVEISGAGLHEGLNVGVPAS